MGVLEFIWNFFKKKTHLEFIIENVDSEKEKKIV